MSGVAGMGPEGQGAYDKTNDAIRVVGVGTGSGGAAAAAADATANPTTGAELTFPHGFNGTTWDRLRAGLSTISATLTGMLNTLPWALFHTSPVTRTNGQGGPLETDAVGNLRTAEQLAPAFEDGTVGVAKVEQRFTYTNQAGTTTGVLVKTGVGFLHALTINTPAASAVITLYDNTAASGTKIATITLPASLVSDGPICVIYDVSFSTGLELVIATGACDVTLAWR